MRERERAVLLGLQALGLTFPLDFPLSSQTDDSGNQHAFPVSEDDAGDHPEGNNTLLSLLGGQRPLLSSTVQACQSAWRSLQTKDKAAQPFRDWYAPV